MEIIRFKDRKWKSIHCEIIEFFKEGKVELYNLDKNISEIKDLSTRYPEIVG